MDDGKIIKDIPPIVFVSGKPQWRLQGGEFEKVDENGRPISRTNLDIRREKLMGGGEKKEKKVLF